MDESNITIYRDVMSLVGNLSLAAAATMGQFSHLAW